MLQFTVTETNTEGNPPIGTTNKRWDFLSPPVMSTGAAHCCTRTFPWTSIGSDIFGAFSEKLTKSPACCISAVLSESAPERGRSDGSLWESAATLQVNYSRSVKSSIRWSIETGCLGLSLSREDLLRVVGGRGGPVTLVVGGKNAPHTESYKAYWCQ